LSDATVIVTTTGDETREVSISNDTVGDPGVAITNVSTLAGAVVERRTSVPRPLEGDARVTVLPVRRLPPTIDFADNRNAFNGALS
jgi:hypothetical protein